MGNDPTLSCYNKKIFCCKKGHKQQNELTTSQVPEYDVTKPQNEIILQVIDELALAAVNNDLEVIAKYVGTFMISPN